MLIFPFGVYVLLLSIFYFVLAFLLSMNTKERLIASCFYLQKSAAKPVQAPQGYSSSAPYLGSGAPSSMYLGVPPYGSSLFNGSSIPPYDVPFSGGSAYHYNYGSRLSTGSPYRPLHLSGPAPYSGGSMIGNGNNDVCFFKFFLGLSISWFANDLNIYSPLLLISMFMLLVFKHFLIY